MSYHEVKGDLFEFDFDAVAHGCNTRGVMGAGIAKQFAQRYPNMEQHYRWLCQRGDFKLGSVMTWGGKPTIFNLGTQTFPGANAELEAVRWTLWNATKDSVAYGHRTFGIPLIGAGIGGLNPEDVKAVFRAIGENITLELTLVELPS